MRSLEGANCAGLPPAVAEKYFDCNVHLEPLRAMVARAICGRCIVREACREDALNANSTPARGVIAGMSANQMKDARRWRNYEIGIVDTPPDTPRPSWLPLPDAAQRVEQSRLESDPDEPAPEI